MRRLFFVFFGIILTLFPSYFTFAFEVKEDTKEIDLKGQLYVYEDITNTLNFNGITRQPGFRKLNADEHSFGYSKSNFWLKSSFIYTGNKPQNFYLVYPIPLTYNVDFYLVDKKNTLIKSSQNGMLTPFDQREEENRYYIFNMHLEPGQNYTFYSMLHNEQGSLSMSIRFMSTKAFHRFYDTETYIVLSFLALIVLSLIITFVLFAYFKERLYLYYMGYLMAIFLIRFSLFGFSFKYLYPDFPEINPFSKVGFWLIATICFINFVPLLLSASKLYFVRAKRIFTIQSFMYLGILVYSLLPFQNSNFSTYLVYFMQANYLFSMAIILLISYKSFQKGFGPASYFAFAFVPLILIILVTMMSNYGFIPNSILTTYPIEIGVTIEIFFLFGAIMNRYHLMMEERKKLDERLKILEKIMADKDKSFENLKIDELSLQSILIKMEKMVEKGKTGMKYDDYGKYQHSKYSIEEVDFKHNVLSNYMNEHKPYLQEDINLHKLSELTGIHSHLISQIINQKENKNFNDFINCYRVDYAMILLKSDKYNHLSVEGIGYECGFNTKATFYATFKKQTSKTPAEFRKQEFEA